MLFQYQYILIYIYIGMNDTSFLKIYLRKTNGSGQHVLVNPHITSRLLYNFISQIFNLPDKSFCLISKNIKILDTTQVTLQALQLQAGSIIHIKQNGISKNDEKLQINQSTLEIRVFCQGSLYMYKTHINSTIKDLKYEMVNLVGCQLNHITIVYLGKILHDEDTLLEKEIRDKDLLSVVITHLSFDKRSSVKLKPKMAESRTFAATQEETDINYQPFEHQVMRKSSMKSSQQQTRQFRRVRQKLVLKTIRPKSSLIRSNNNLQIQKQTNQQSKCQQTKKEDQNQMQNQNQTQVEEEKAVQTLIPKNLEIKNNFAWLTNQKVIQTESINFDDPQQQQGPQKWTECKIQLSNDQYTKFYTLQCNQQHDLNSIIRLLARLQHQNQSSTEQKRYQIIFANQSQQQMADEGSKIIQIARANKIQIIHEAKFKQFL